MSTCSLCGGRYPMGKIGRYAHAREAGHPLMHRENAERDALILSLARDEHMYGKDIAAQLGMSTVNVYASLHRQGYWPRGPLLKKMRRNDHVLAMAARGLPDKRIAALVGLDRATVRHVISSWLAREQRIKATKDTTQARIDEHKAHLRDLIEERRETHA